MQCQWVRADTGNICGARANQVDHIQHGDDHSLTNLQALCAWHHNKKSASEGGAGRAAARRAAASPVATHPGVLP